MCKKYFDTWTATFSVAEMGMFDDTFPCAKIVAVLAYMAKEFKSLEASLFKINDAETDRLTDRQTDRQAAAR